MNAAPHDCDPSGECALSESCRPSSITTASCPMGSSCPVPRITSPWEREMESQGKGTKMNKAMTAAGLLIAFQLAANPLIAQDWAIQTVDPSVNVGYYTSVALDSQGLTHISYYDAYNDALKYARGTGEEWDIDVVDADPPWGDVGWYTAIALDSNDCPHISYYKSTGGGALRHARWDGSAWHIVVVETGYEKIYSSIAIDSSDYPHISYCDEPPGDLKYAWWDGAVWHTTIVEDGFCSGYCTSIAIDSLDYPHISYIDAWEDDLRYARWDGSDWQFASIDAPGFYGDEGIMTSLALDSSDLPHIAYTYWITDDLRYAYHDGAHWQIVTVDSDGCTGKYPSIALDDEDCPHISYARAGGGFVLKYARWTGSIWERTEVDDQGNPGFWTSIALDGVGYPHISYGAGGTSVLRCAWFEGPMGIENGHDDRHSPAIPADFILSSAVPSPSGGTASIRFALPYACDVSLELCDIEGRRVAMLAQGHYGAGTHQREVTGLGAGVYVYRFEAGDFTETEKMVVIE